MGQTAVVLPQREESREAGQGTVELSIVATLYCTGAMLSEFYRRCVEVALRHTKDFEIILVDDGSPDDALSQALDLVEQDPRVRVLELSRNFGHHRAMMTGLTQARGRLVFLIDSDLEEDPELLPVFLDQMKRDTSDVVYGVQISRKGGWVERATGEIFYRAFNWLSDQPIPRNLITARLMKQDYVKALCAYGEREVNLPAIWASAGFHQTPVKVVKHSRGETTYSLPVKLNNLINAVTSFSSRPLLYIFYLGMFVSGCASVGAAHLIIRKLFFRINLEGWASIVVSIWLLGGMTLFALGVIGIYLYKVFLETKQRPYSIVRRVHENRAQVGVRPKSKVSAQ